MANKVILTGRLGDKPELISTGDDGAFAKFSIATKDTWRDKKNGEKMEKTHWHHCIVGNKSAQSLADNMKKGKQYLVEGSLEYSTYEKEGQKHRVAQVRVERVEFL